MGMEELLATLSRGRKGPIRVIEVEIPMFHQPQQPENPAAGAQTGQGATEISGNSYARRDEAPTPPKPVGEVPATVEALLLALAGLEKSVAILQDKLDPMLQPGQATAGTNAAPAEPPAGTIIGERLREAVAMVVALRRRVADITERAAL